MKIEYNKAICKVCNKNRMVSIVTKAGRKICHRCANEIYLIIQGAPY